MPCDLDLRDMTSSQGYDTPLDHGQQAYVKYHPNTIIRCPKFICHSLIIMLLIKVH